MDLKEISEAIYASSNGVVIERRKGILMPALILLSGAALLVVNYFIDNGDDANNLKSALVLIGGCLLLVGVVMCGVRIFGGGEPYHKGDNCFLVRKQYSFNREQRRDVEKAVNDIDVAALDSLGESDVDAVIVVTYCSPNSNYVAMQAFAYEEFIYKPISEVKIKC